jgi:1-acyl-sn-glycerol-3-phosphate acyltransferase
MEPWHYAPAQDLEEPFLERLRRCPREPDMLVYSLRTCAAAIIRSWLSVFHRFRIIGRENLPRQGSFVLAANHSSHLDALCLLSALPLRKLHCAFPLAARDYFFVTAPRTFVAAVVTNALPMERRLSPRQSLTVCRHLLDKPGSILIVFPEGTRTTTGELGDFKPGVGTLLAGTEHPVLPCYLDGAFAAWPKGAWCPRPTHVKLRIGTPRVYSHLPSGKESAVQICRELHAAVAELAGGRGGTGGNGKQN